MVSKPAIEVRSLRKSYGDVEAVRGIDLRVEPGEIFAFLGPNGAGKTTTVEILEGYRNRDGGEVTVLGEDPSAAPRAWRQRIGVVLQQSRSAPELSVRETVELFAGYYDDPRPVDEVLALTDLAPKASARIRTLSGGQQRRLDVALALAGDPDLLFLDEPTTGFDPAARRQSWEVISGLRGLGKTIFLTTHYLDEAQELADRVAIIAAGEIVAAGTPLELTRRAGSSELTFSLPEGTDAEPPVNGRARRDGRRVRVPLADPVRELNQLTAWALGAGVELEGIEVRHPSLEDIYLELIEEQP